MNKESLYKIISIVGLILVLALFSLLQKPSHKPESPKPQTQTEVKSQPTNPTDQVLFISKIGVWVPIVYVAGTDEIRVQTALTQGVVHYPDTAKPGEVGNVYLAGRSASALIASPYDTVFSGLTALTVGDTISIVEQSGQMNYVVVATYSANPDNTSAASQTTAGRRLMTLQIYNPSGPHNQRFVVVAELK